MALPPGTRLGPYEILDASGAGGMGEVYRARDTRLDRAVALKLLPAAIQHDAQRRTLLRREARAIAALDHPHICALHDVSSDGDVEFLVMEHLEGETLAHRLKRGPLPLPEALRIATEIGEALAAAHRAGVVHRDLKPSNVMLTRAGVKLLDFGLAKLAPAPAHTDPATPETATALGMVAGTIFYMAPEQLEGRVVDARSDLFAFGAVLYEMLTGRRAFSGDSPAAVVAAVLGAPLPAPSTLRPEIPRALDRVVAASLARDPEERWQSALDVVRVLRWLTNDVDGGAAERAIGKHRPAWRLHAAWAALALALLLLPRGHGPAQTAAPPANPQPVVVLMDSPLPGRVYDPRTEAAGEANADDITDALRELPVVIQKENTSAMWHREEQVLRQRPDLIVSHLSCLLDARVASGQQAVEDHLFGIATSRLMLFFGYVASLNPRTRFLVYSRGAFVEPAAAGRWVEDVESRLPALRGRLHAFSVPHGLQDATFRDPDTARLIRERVKPTFRDPDTARLIRERVKQLLGLP